MPELDRGVSSEGFDSGFTGGIGGAVVSGEDGMSAGQVYKVTW